MKRVHLWKLNNWYNPPRCKVFFVSSGLFFFTSYQGLLNILRDVFFGKIFFQPVKSMKSVGFGVAPRYLAFRTWKRAAPGAAWSWAQWPPRWTVRSWVEWFHHWHMWVPWSKSRWKKYPWAVWTTRGLSTNQLVDFGVKNRDKKLGFSKFRWLKWHLVGIFGEDLRCFLGFVFCWWFFTDCTMGVITVKTTIWDTICYSFQHQTSKSNKTPGDFGDVIKANVSRSCGFRIP